jgi:DNA modification methylase
MKIVEYKCKDLIGAEYNPRELTQKQYTDLKDSLLRFGVVDPVLVNINEDRKNIIIGGHQRKRVWEELGNKTIPCVELDLTLDQERELNVRLNKNTGQFDMDALANYFDQDELIDWGFESFEFGMEDFEVDELGDEELEEDDFDVDEAAKQVDVVEGDLIEIGEHRLLCGSSTNSDHVSKLMNGKKANMVFTDPPYGVSYEGGHNKKKRKGIIADEFQGEDLSTLFEDAINNACVFSEDNAPFYIWYAGGKSIETYQGLSKTPIQVRAVICWYKVKSGLGAFMSQYIPNYEPCIYGHKEGKSIQWFGPTDEKTVWEFPKDRVNNFHPTQKPVEVVGRALKNSSKQGQLIYDAFAGSGSTMFASHELGRVCYEMELDPKYCQVIIERMHNSFPELEIKINGKKYIPNS